MAPGHFACTGPKQRLPRAKELGSRPNRSRSSASDQPARWAVLDCFATLAMTTEEPEGWDFTSGHIRDASQEPATLCLARSRWKTPTPRMFWGNSVLTHSISEPSLRESLKVSTPSYVQGKFSVNTFGKGFMTPLTSGLFQTPTGKFSVNTTSRLRNRPRPSRGFKPLRGN